jgi:hypothetical protein
MPGCLQLHFSYQSCANVKPTKILGYILMLVIREWLEIHQKKNRGQLVGIYYIWVCAYLACSTVRSLVFQFVGC